mmetsp:Transcript_1841/g.1941  ORF Transcript_1841/g.1941 Transcript_1841/m.1941 type:complete len:206 (-) Transcript_1841:130-747(-)
MGLKNLEVLRLEQMEITTVKEFSLVSKILKNIHNLDAFTWSRMGNAISFPSVYEMVLYGLEVRKMSELGVFRGVSTLETFRRHKTWPIRSVEDFALLLYFRTTTLGDLTDFIVDPCYLEFCPSKANWEECATALNSVRNLTLKSFNIKNTLLSTFRKYFLQHLPKSVQTVRISLKREEKERLADVSGKVRKDLEAKDIDVILFDE